MCAGLTASSRDACSEWERHSCHQDDTASATIGTKLLTMNTPEADPAALDLRRFCFGIPHRTAEDTHG
jgi:hypothetical protein